MSQKVALPEGYLDELDDARPPVPEAEEALSKRLLHELGLHTGRGEELATEQALEFVASIQDFDGHIEGDGLEAFQLGPELVPNLSLHADDLELDFGGVDAKAVAGGDLPVRVRPGHGAGCARARRRAAL